MTRDVASRFHAKMGETFVLPEGKIQESTMLIPGTDGEKMSKSKGNIINIFYPKKNYVSKSCLLKQIVLLLKLLKIGKHVTALPFINY